ncbi:ABC transporter permease [Methylobacterium terricola]|uniref:ABC transporter permease n=1 Tax=Methylobacterium terricola TaxID=2583531 RepID=A0A5C4L4D2_9HYPH|nr:ABC transporter permease [Methylobacterium terricola]TNC04972.1 ABC transporter permease [Methylobacterium terricola]
MQSTTHTERLGRTVLRLFSAAVLVFLVAPVLIVIPLSFNESAYFSYPMSGFSTQWYAALVSSKDWRLAIVNSFVIGIASTAIATMLGTAAAMGISRPSFPFRSFIMPLLISPMIIPIVVVAVSLYLVFSPLGLTSSYAGVILAHAALGTPFVVITVTATLMSFNRNLVRAAASLGAPPLLTFRRVTLPLIAPGVATGAVFAFATSFDEVIVILFIGGPEQKTIPRQMWSGIRDQINPSILAMAALLTVFAIAMFLIIDWLHGRAASASNNNN